MPLPTVLPRSRLGSTINKIINHASSNTLEGSKDLSVTKTTNGMLIKLADGVRNQSAITLTYRGEYDPDEAYSRFDIVRVLSSTAYTTYNNTVVSAEPGLWICVADVPSLIGSDKRKAAGLTHGPMIRHESVDYYPLLPEPTATLESVQGQSDPLVKADIRYWELIGVIESDPRWS
jgi:hypothetical protein